MRAQSRRLCRALWAALLLPGPAPAAPAAPISAAPVTAALIRSKHEALLDAKAHESPRMRAALLRAAEAEGLDRYAQAVAALRAAPAASDADRLVRRVTLADIEGDWGESLAGARPAEAIPHLEAALATDRADQPQKVPAAFGEIGDCYSRSGRYAQAVTAYRQGIAAAAQTQALMAPSDEADLLDGLGDASLDHGRPDVAADSFRSALSLCQKSDSPIGKAVALDGLGRAALAQKRPAEALTSLRQSLAVLRQFEGLAGQSRASALVTARALDHLGEAHAALHRPAQALGEYQKALRLARQLEDGAAADVRDLTAEVAKQTDPADKADSAAERREPARLLALLRADVLPKLQADIAAARLALKGNPERPLR